MVLKMTLQMLIEDDTVACFTFLIYNYLYDKVIYTKAYFVDEVLPKITLLHYNWKSFPICTKSFLKMYDCTA